MVGQGRWYSPPAYRVSTAHIDSHSMTTSFCARAAAPARGVIDCGLVEEKALCRSIATIQNATCLELLNESFVERTIAALGRPKGNSCCASVGIWESSSHLARAFLSLAVRLTPRLATRLVFTNFQNGWSSMLFAAYLQRCSANGIVSGLVSGDIRAERSMSRSGRKELLPRLNLTFRAFPEINGSADALATGQNVPYDVCFLSGGRYDRVQSQYERLAPWCAYMLFYGIADYRAANASGGGQPAFWTHLLEETPTARTSEVGNDRSTEGGEPVGGIGILEPNAHGDALTARPVAEWPQWHQAGDHDVLWHHMCSGREQSSWLCSRYKEQPTSRN